MGLLLVLRLVSNFDTILKSGLQFTELYICCRHNNTISNNFLLSQILFDFFNVCIQLQEIASLLKAIIGQSPQNILGDDIATLRFLIEGLPEFHAQSIVRKLLVVFCLQFKASESTKREILSLVIIT